MATGYSGKAPWHLWAAGLASLLWNAFGAYDYVMSHTGGPEYFASMGLDAEVYAWFQSFPAWAVAAWAIGVWSSVLGSILLLVRSRHAETAFLVSALGAAVSFAYQFSNAMPGSIGGANAVMPLVIIIMIVAQWYYARRMRAAGVLR